MSFLGEARGIFDSLLGSESKKKVFPAARLQVPLENECIEMGQFHQLFFQPNNCQTHTVAQKIKFHQKVNVTTMRLVWKLPKIALNFLCIQGKKSVGEINSEFPS